VLPYPPLVGLVSGADYTREVYKFGLPDWLAISSPQVFFVKIVENQVENNSNYSLYTS
jgi:hypothetical protein